MLKAKVLKLKDNLVANNDTKKSQSQPIKKKNK